VGVPLVPSFPEATGDENRHLGKVGWERSFEPEERPQLLTVIRELRTLQPDLVERGDPASWARDNVVVDAPLFRGHGIEWKVR
jgi:hypothetical protein